MTTSTAGAPAPPLAGHWSPAGGINWRDLGGLPTRMGGRTRAGVIFRSGTLQELGADDVAVITEVLGVRTVIDVRSPRESLVEGSGLLGRTAVPHHRLPLAGSPARGPLAGTRAEVSGHLAAWYLSMAHSCGPQIAAAFRVLADSAGTPAVIHGSGGKDRCGVLVALVLAAVGVDDATVAAEYARSLDDLPRVLGRLSTMPSYAVDPLGLRVDLNRTDAPTMLLLLAALRSEHGSVASYLEGIGVAARTLAALRSALVA